jgi:hypothetical protein
LAAGAVGKTFGASKPDSKFGGVQVGANVPIIIRGMPGGAEDILKYCLDPTIGISALELRSRPVEDFLGAPPPAAGRGGGGRGGGPSRPGAAGGPGGGAPQGGAGNAGRGPGQGAVEGTGGAPAGRVTSATEGGAGAAAGGQRQRPQVGPEQEWRRARDLAPWGAGGSVALSNIIKRRVFSGRCKPEKSSGLQPVPFRRWVVDGSRRHRTRRPPRSL